MNTQPNCYLVFEFLTMTSQSTDSRQVISKMCVLVIVGLANMF